MNTGFISALIGIAAFLIRFLMLGTIENDHYVYLARAHQVLHGDWPVRDFADPGMPLAYLLSAAAAALAGPMLLTDAVLSIALFAAAIAVTHALVRRASGSMTLALVAVAVILLLPPRLYNWSKLLIPVVAIAFAWAYSDGPSTRRAAALGLWTGLGFLVRHDYAIYLGAGAAALFLVRHWGEWKMLAVAAGTYAVVAVGTVAPWLIYVHAQQGLPEYLGSAMRFAAAERNRTVTPWPLVFYVLAAVPLVAVAIAARGTRYLSPAQVIFVGVTVFVSELVLLRDEPLARIPDVTATTAIAAAIVAGRYIRLEKTERVERTPPILLTSALITVAAVALFTARASIEAAVPTLLGRWHLVVTRLRDASPQVTPEPSHAALVRLIQRCVAPHERVLIGGFAPELPVLARRAFAGGLPDWIRGYYEDPADVSRAESRLQRERVAFAVMLDGGQAFTRSWPTVARILRERGLTAYNLELPSGPVEVWLRPATPLDGTTSLPCSAP